MRPIDADWLLDVVENIIKWDTERDRNRIIHQVRELTPTIEPERKKGKWIVYEAPDRDHCGMVKCPFCGECMIAESDEYNYCPDCGADLREQP